MRSAIRPPTSRKKNAVKRYCFPMVLWSSDHTYFQKNPVGSGWMWSSADPPAGSVDPCSWASVLIYLTPR